MIKNEVVISNLLILNQNAEPQGYILTDTLLPDGQPADAEPRRHELQSRLRKRKATRQRKFYCSVSQIRLRAIIRHALESCSA